MSLKIDFIVFENHDDEAERLHADVGNADSTWIANKRAVLYKSEQQEDAQQDSPG